MVDQLLRGAIAFSRNAVGVAVKPYETYRRIAAKGTLYELVYLALSLALYFAAASWVKTASFRPFLLTHQFVVLALAATGGYLLSVGVFLFVGQLLGGSKRVAPLFLTWGYTLLPTVVWFWVTSFLYVILPPPRTESPAGIIFSIVYLVFSTMMLAWKLTLGYLSLRFGLKLDLARILVVGAAALAAWGAYSTWMYQAGIFRVPFL